ncbi:MAG: tetratricopeptide repeat protein [Mesorhizobium sp.]|uniref:tetratricopeptide repeat protein n=1 Tax=Mesorhizobium sp. TaxID=1871066 RepID=UPI00121B2ABA|nr:tetratricopeptide repeat protein [Mesorhizobium sp.]TIO75540.1 MAG: tetratricopeptide repeat protein [Mesorhizobium sp.]TIO82861.1 MAG: tetratricopeptide repeat protein [Mesorhizobium sp.]
MGGFGGIARCRKHQHTESIRLPRRVASQPAFARQREPRRWNSAKNQQPFRTNEPCRRNACADSPITATSNWRLVKHIARPLDLNPYDADTLAQIGHFRALRGDGEAGLALLDKAIQLNPMHPGWYYADRAAALFVLGRYRDVVACLSCLPRKSAWQWAWLAACHALEGDVEKARACARQGRALEPGLTVKDFLADLRMKRTEDRERMRLGLQRAGWDDALP